MADPRLIGAKTLFATHYHELTELEGKLPGVKNYCIAVKEKGDDIVFLRKIVRGGADKSYGIQVARLAGVPEAVLLRAKEIVAELVSNDLAGRAREIAGQMRLFAEEEEHPVLKELRNCSVETMTPMEALNFLYRLQQELD